MKHQTQLLLSPFALLPLLIGCRDGAPPSPEPGAEPSATAAATRMTKLHPGAARAISPSMRHLTVDLSDGGAAPDGGEGPAAPARIWSFDADKPEGPPLGFDFAASAGKPGKWVVKADPGASTAPNVLAQTDADKTEGRFLTAVAAEPSLRDARVSTRCKPVSGKVDQVCGVVFRFQDAKNYYVARANLLEKDVNLYAVKDGKRTLLGGWKSPLAAAWHEIRVDAKGDHLAVSWDGTIVYATDDKTFSEAGRFGLWTKSDAVTYFDDFSVTPL